jgi:uncharacterized delta-60 repeat protein
MWSSSHRSSFLAFADRIRTPRPKKLAALALLAALAGLAPRAVGQAGAIDPTFNVFDNGTFGDGADSYVFDVVVQPDGKMVIAGSFTSYNGALCGRVARLNENASIDPSFDVGLGANHAVNCVTPQPDGKLVLGGFFTSYNGSSRARLARVNSDGSLDTSFNTGPGVRGNGNSAYVTTIALQPDGKMLIGGRFDSYDGVPRQHIARVNPDGGLDTSFDPGTGANSEVLNIVVRPDGKSLVGGYFTSYNGVTMRGVVQLNADGSLDTSFDPSASMSGSVDAIALQPDGKVLIGGSFQHFSAVIQRNLVRLHADGSIDATFNTGFGPNALVRDIELQSNGKLVIAGYFDSYNTLPTKKVVRVNADGTLDTSLTAQLPTSSQPESLVLRSNGSMVVVGETFLPDSTIRGWVASLDSNGNLDPALNPGAGADFKVWTVAMQSDGKALLGGEFTRFNATSRNHLVRLNADGSLDTSFDIGAGTSTATSTGPYVYDVDIQPDGKVLIVGGFTVYNGVFRRRVARLNSDGSLDLSFDMGFGANGQVAAVTLQPDGKILISGYFSAISGITRNRLARLNADGSVDTGYDPGSGTGFAGTFAQTLQPDGKLLIAGNFSSFNGTPRDGVARLNADASVDMSFDPGVGISDESLDGVRAIALQPDGRILIGGRFTSYGGVPRGGVARIHANGSLDTSFDPGLGAANEVRALALQPDGRVLIGGSFLSFDGVPRGRIARLNSDGSLDASFDPGVGANGVVESMALTANGMAVVAGSFTKYGDSVRHRIVRVRTVAPGVTTNYCTAGTSAIGCTPTMSASGIASAAATSGYVVTTSNIEGQRQTNTIYGLLGPTTPATPFGAGLLCVKAPTQRIGVVQASGTPGLCDGTVSIDVLAWAQANPGGQGVPFAAGTTLDFQCAIRDPLSPGTRVMSDALQVTLLP